MGTTVCRDTGCLSFLRNHTKFFARASIRRRSEGALKGDNRPNHRSGATETGVKPMAHFGFNKISTRQRGDVRGRKDGVLLAIPVEGVPLVEIRVIECI